MFVKLPKCYNAAVTACTQSINMRRKSIAVRFPHTAPRTCSSLAMREIFLAQRRRLEAEKVIILDTDDEDDDVSLQSLGEKRGLTFSSVQRVEKSSKVGVWGHHKTYADVLRG